MLNPEWVCAWVGERPCRRSPPWSSVSLLAPPWRHGGSGGCAPGPPPAPHRGSAAYCTSLGCAGGAAGRGLRCRRRGRRAAGRTKPGPGLARRRRRSELGETTASGGGCGMRDAGAAANGGAGRRAGAMATANGGPGRGPAAAAGRRASGGFRDCACRGGGGGGDPPPGKGAPRGLGRGAPSRSGVERSWEPPEAGSGASESGHPVWDVTSELGGQASPSPQMSGAWGRRGRAGRAEDGGWTPTPYPRHQGGAPPA